MDQAGPSHLGLAPQPLVIPPDLGRKGLWSQLRCADPGLGTQGPHQKEILTLGSNHEGGKVLFRSCRHQVTPTPLCCMGHPQGPASNQFTPASR